MNYIEVEITPEMMVEAQNKAQSLGVLKNSITRGDGNLTGFLGEMVAQKVIGGEIVGTKDYDIITEDGETWDVKTKRCNCPPEDHWECSVTNYNTIQNCKRYVFVRLMKDYTKGYVIGYLPKEEYFQKATFIRQGQYDPRNHWRAKCDCWNVVFTDLNEVKQFGIEEPSV